MVSANIYQTLHVCQSPTLAHFTSEVGVIFVAILWMRKLRTGDIERLGHVC